MAQKISHMRIFVFRLIFIICLISLDGYLQAQSVVINEFLASNQSGITDEDGDTSDWVELYNAGTSDINLLGYTLTDDADDPDQWVFPSVVLESHSYLLIWASGKDRVNPSALHANFRLDVSGEYIGLYAPDSSLCDGIDFGSQSTDISYGRYPDGSDNFYTF